MPYSLDINLEDLGKYSFYLTPDSLEILERKRVKITYGKKQGISKEVLGKGREDYKIIVMVDIHFQTQFCINFIEN